MAQQEKIATTHKIFCCILQTAELGLSDIDHKKSLENAKGLRETNTVE